MQVKLIRTSGKIEVMEIAKTDAIGHISRLIGANGLDTVNLRDGNVMLVDDTGVIDNRPVNALATEFYRAICRPGTMYSIHGDVAIVIDKDFA